MMLKKYSRLGFSAVLGLGLCTVALAQQDRADSSAAAKGSTSTPPAKPALPGLKPSAAISADNAAPAPAAAKTAPVPVAANLTPAQTLTPPATDDVAEDSGADADDDQTPLVVRATNVDSTPQVLMAKADPTAKEASLFPRFTKLKPVVAFWTQIFGDYSDNQSVIHSMDYPQKVFEVLDFRSEAARMSAADLAQLRARREKETKEHYDDVLAQVDKLRKTPDQMNSEQRRIFDLYADVPGDNRFKDAIGTLRAQRGLKDRTEQALDVSSKYLPSMEATFRSYQLPVTLTRLPLVESSFNVEAYSKSGAAGIWQFIPSSARIYMRLNNIVDDRRDPWTSTDAAARHLKDDYTALGSWPLAVTAYNHGRGGIARALAAVNGTTLMDLIERFDGHRFGFASKNYYAEFLAAVDVERRYTRTHGEPQKSDGLRFDVVETSHYVPYETLRRLCGASDELFRKLNPAYRPEVIEGKMYVPPGHLIRVPAGSAKTFEVAYSKLSSNEKFDSQRSYYELVKVKHGDTLSGIARRYRVSQASIERLNELGKKRHLRVGQILKVPPHMESRPGPVTVAIGESKPQQTRAQRRAELSEATRTFRIHKVKSGQTLSGIAQHYNTSVAKLCKVNNLREKSRIKPGMRLKIPPT